MFSRRLVKQEKNIWLAPGKGGLEFPSGFSRMKIEWYLKVNFVVRSPSCENKWNMILFIDICLDVGNNNCNKNYDMKNGVTFALWCVEYPWSGTFRQNAMSRKRIEIIRTPPLKTPQYINPFTPPTHPTHSLGIP